MSDKTTRGEAILHPQRLRLLRALASGPKTPRELVLELRDVPQASVYRHLSTLLQAGIVHVVAETPVRGVLERTYALEPGSAVLGPDDLASTTREEHFRYFATYITGLLAQYGRYLDRDTIDIAADGLGYRELVLNLTDTEFDDLVRSLQQLLRPLAANKPGGDRRPRLLATMFIPLDDSPKHTQKETE